jgi:imidazolonepropionase-like amidohydrolase
MRAVDSLASGGAEVVKIYSGYGPTGAMPAEVVRAVVREAHRHGLPVFVHPENAAGMKVAVEAGADVFAHTVTREAVDPSLLRRMRSRRIALVPTLQCWDYWATRQGKPADEARGMMRNAEDELRRYAAMGGRILFGTDIGGITDHDPSGEYRRLAESGLDYRAILASLTTAPAAFFRVSSHAGRIAPGMDADLVVLESDPARDVLAFARVKYAIRAGRLIHGGDPSGSAR